MLFTDEADLAAGWSSLAGDAASGYSFGVFTRMVPAGALSMDRLKIVWQSPLIPFGPHVVRRDLPGGGEDPDRLRPHGDGPARRPTRSTRSTVPASAAAASCRRPPRIIR